MKKFLTFLTSFAIATGIVYAALGTNIIAYYKLQSDGTDSVGTVGTISGTSPTFTTGIIGNGGSFASASSQYLESSTFAGSDDWTFNFWFNPTTNQSQNPITKDAVAGSNRIYNLSFSATQATLFAWGTGGNFHQTTAANHNMSTGSWYMWSATWDNANNVVTLYKNCVSFATITLTGNEKANANSVALDIGRQAGGVPTGYVNGKIDEIGLWSRALSSTELCQLYNGGAPTTAQQYPFTPLAPLWWNWYF